MIFKNKSSCKILGFFRIIYQQKLATVVPEERASLASQIVQNERLVLFFFHKKISVLAAQVCLHFHRYRILFHRKSRLCYRA